MFWLMLCLGCLPVLFVLLALVSMTKQLNGEGK